MKDAGAVTDDGHERHVEEKRHDGRRRDRRRRAVVRQVQSYVLNPYLK